MIRRVLLAAGILGCSTAHEQRGPLLIKPIGFVAWRELPLVAANGTHMRTADVWGDPSTGAHGSLTVLPAGFMEPWHRHAHDLRLVVIAGEMRFGLADSEGDKLSPGSFASIPAGLTHRAECVSSSECLVYVQQDGPMNVEPVSPAPR
jgi:quercetin dioxygenase-like cupin family protein